MRWMTDAQTAAVSRSSGNTRLRAQPDGDGGAGDGSEAAAEDRGATSIDAQKMDEIEKVLNREQKARSPPAKYGGFLCTVCSVRDGPRGELLPRFRERLMRSV